MIPLRQMTVAVLIAALVLLVAAPVSAAPGDRSSPRVGFTTQDSDVIVPAGGDTAAAAVEGWARDRRPGIRRVMVTYCPGHKGPDGSWTCSSTGALAGPSSVRARLSCTARGRSCTWSARVPSTPGRYLVFARAVDRAGHARSAGPIEIYVAASPPGRQA